MNTFQTCKDTSDIVPLYIPQQLYLKPVAKINISLQIPKLKAGKSISHWEIMEKLRELIKPQEFSILKVSKSTLEFVKFEAEIETRKRLENTISKLEHKTIKLKNFSELMRLRAGVVKSDFPNRRTWDGFFQEAKDMDEMKPGERPDTVHFSNLPTKWFVPYHLLDEEDSVPSEKIFYKIFEKFGPIRYVDIPICDPYRSKMKDHISGIKNCPLEDKTMFEGYVQYKDYMGFTKCMDVLRDMKLVHKDEDETVAVDIKVDFDRSKHLSDASVRRREIVRDRLVKRQREKEEKERNELEEKQRRETEEKKKEISMKQQKEQRRKLREEKRKAVVLEKLKIRGADEINAKIAKEEKKLLKVQRKLESIRLMEELFKRIKEKRESEKVNSYSLDRGEADNELKRYKNTSELEVLNQKQKLHTAIQGRVMLKTVLKDNQFHEFSSSSSDEESQPLRRSPMRDEDIRSNERLPHADIYDPPMWYGYPYHMPPSLPALYQAPLRGHHPYGLFPRGRRGFPRGPQYSGQPRGAPFTRRSRGYRSQYRGGHASRRQYPPEIEEEYIKYFSKFLQNEHDDRGRRSRSRTRRSRSRSYSRRRSSSRRRSHSRSVSRSRRSSSRSRSRSRSRRFNSSSRRSHSRRSSPRSRKSKSRSRSGSRRRRTRSATRRSESGTRRSKSRTRSPSRQRKTSSRKSRSRSRSRSRTSKRTRSKDGSYSRNQSSSRKSNVSPRGRTPEKNGSKNEHAVEKGGTQSPDRKSIDSSVFISPSTMRRERSKSWSMPREDEKETRSWSQPRDEQEKK